MGTTGLTPCGVYLIMRTYEMSPLISPDLTRQCDKYA